jgi:hypothetical protein
MPRVIPINWDDLETAVERNSPDAESFLELATGQVISIVVGEPEAPALKRKVAANIDGFLRIDPASSREQYRWMERFVSSVADEPLRDRLIISIDGKGAFRRFKDVLIAYPAERERWFTYRADLLHWHIHNWLREHDVESSVPPPWGEPKPPPELPEVVGRPIVHGAEAPGESLRRQARDLIDVLAPIDLPSAIAFLEFLRARGALAAPGRIDDDDAIPEPADSTADRTPDTGREAAAPRRLAVHEPTGPVAVPAATAAASGGPRGRQH